MSEEEERGIRVSVTFPKKDAEWLQGQVESGEYTSLAEAIRMCVRTVRTGNLEVAKRELRGEGVVIPTELVAKALQNPELLMQILESLNPKS